MTRNRKRPGPGWHREQKRHRQAAKLGWARRRGTAKPSYSPDELRRIHERRSLRSRKQDERKNSKRILGLEHPLTDSWANDPGSMDVEGIDDVKPAKEDKRKMWKDRAAYFEAWKDRVPKDLKNGEEIILVPSRFSVGMKPMQGKIIDIAESGRKILILNSNGDTEWIKAKWGEIKRVKKPAGGSAKPPKDGGFITVLEPYLNKQHHVTEYDEQFREGEFSTNRVKVVETQRIPKGEFNRMISGFLDFGRHKGEEWLHGKGGVESDVDVPEGTDYYDLTQEQREKFREGAYDVAIKVTDGSRVVYINPHGHDYARYVYFPENYVPGDLELTRRGTRRKKSKRNELAQQNIDELKKWSTPPFPDDVVIHIPKGSENSVEQAKAHLQRRITEMRRYSNLYQGADTSRITGEQHHKAKWEIDRLENMQRHLKQTGDIVKMRGGVEKGKSKDEVWNLKDGKIVFRESGGR